MNTPVPRRGGGVGIVVALWLLSGSGFVVAANSPVASSAPVAAPRSPVDSFRRLLALPLTERAQYLTNRTAEVQKRLLEKIREYQALTLEERELRLTATELRWHLLPLMSAPATNRSAQLAQIPVGLRDLVATRLRQWDQLAPVVQQRLLTNQQTAIYLAGAEAGAPTPVSPVDQIRRRLQGRFNRFLELSASEKETILRSFSDAERGQMERTLAAYTKLTPGQRQRCLVSFSKFATMNPAEQQEFLKNAERWSQMSPAERQAWRDLVSAAPSKPALPIFRRPSVPPRTAIHSAPSMVPNGG